MGWHQTCNRTPKGCQRRPPQATQPPRSEVRAPKRAQRLEMLRKTFGWTRFRSSPARTAPDSVAQRCHAPMITVLEKNVLASVWRHADQAVADDTGNPEVTGRVECQSVRKIARAELRDGFASGSMFRFRPA
ncbi:MAG: hypothetical protein Ct9H300mP16_19020 [Pseudomonadota bacterium]|nr:MAG: hypothetical protein Ct9H300mP16_19020 [Pseudomonadota bacterium]